MANMNVSVLDTDIFTDLLGAVSSFTKRDDCPEDFRDEITGIIQKYKERKHRNECSR